MRRALTIAAVMILGSVAPAFAASADDLKFFESEAKVVTASRREQAAAEIPLATDVVTQAEIKASGAANIWDLLRFRVGMDVMDARSVDGNRGIVAVRGFPQEFAQNVLVLVDGRSVYSSQSGGVYWDQLPVQIQDLARIEIIRGPNTALYGSGAALGVINFITKKPQAGRTSLALDNAGGNLGAVRSYQAVESTLAKASYRLSHTYQEQNGYPSASSAGVTDFLRKNVVNFRADAPLSARTDLELFAGASWVGTGAPTTGNPSQDFDHDFEMARLTHKLSADSSIEASSSRSDSNSRLDPTANGVDSQRELQYDAEILHRVTWADGRMNTTYGGSYRKVQLSSLQLYRSAPRPWLEIDRGYLHQTAKPVDALTLQGALALENSNVAGLKPSYQLAAILAPTTRDAFRASYSLAYTLPSMYPLFSDTLAAQGLRLVGSPQLQPFKLISYETGYTGNRFDKRLEAGISLFYTTIANFQTAAFKSFAFAPPLTTLQFANNDDAIARGAELDLKYRFSRSRSVYANYTYEHVTDQIGDVGQKTGNTPASKVNFGGMSDAPGGFSVSANAGYKDKYFITSIGRTVSVAVPSYWRVDARLAHALPGIKDAECYVSGQNLLAPRHVEFADGLTVPRTFSGGVLVKF